MPQVYEANIRVRFGDTDMYGHVNNASFATYMEEARVQFMESELGGFRLPLILANASYQFVKQTKFPEDRDIVCRMWFSQIGNSSATIQAEIVNAHREPVCRAEATVVHFDYQKQRPARLPDDVRETFERYFIADAE